MVTVKKKVGDREALRYRRWDRGRNRNAEGQTRVGWKELLAWVTAGEDYQLEDDQAVELHSYFLGDKKIFDGRGNVESPHPDGDRCDADRTGVWDLGGGRDIGSEEVDPG